MLPLSLLYLSILLSKALVSGSYLPGDRQIPFTMTSSYVVPEIGHEAAAHVKKLYWPESRFETYDKGRRIPSCLAHNSLNATAATAITVVQDLLGLRDGQVAYTSGYSTEMAHYAYLAQSQHEIPFVNAVANIVLQDGKLVTFGSSFVNLDEVQVASPHPSIHVEDAISMAEHIFSGFYDKQPITLKYYVKESGSVALVYAIQVYNESPTIYVQAYVDAHTGVVVGAADFVARIGNGQVNAAGIAYMYNVIPIEGRSPDALSLEVNPQDSDCSPQGWHGLKNREGDDNDFKLLRMTAGNNAISYIGAKDHTSGPSEESKNPAEELVFNYKHHNAAGPRQDKNPDVARTNAFYVVNRLHDIAYRYGFTEKAFNYQDYNFKRGGKESDRIQIEVQDADTAEFIPTPDGQVGTLKIPLYYDEASKTYRDGALDNSIIVHEMTHGITRRLLSGGTSICAQDLEARGMQEGWSDIMIGWTEQTSKMSADFVVAKYAFQKEGGIRRAPYSREIKFAKFMYSGLAEAFCEQKEYYIGEIWASMLFNVYDELVMKNGFSADAMENPKAKGGNVVFMHLLMESWRSLGCDPTFFRAKEAMIDADKRTFEGVNKCAIHKGFAFRGLGINAKERFPYQDNHDIPNDC